MTGRRQLEQFAFEVVSTQSLSDAGHKAAKLVARDVRRVFAIDVERSRALEWSTAFGTWRMLDAAGHLMDPVFVVPLPIEMLVRSARTDDAVARALVAKHNPVIEATDDGSSPRHLPPPAARHPAGQPATSGSARWTGSGRR